MKLKNKLILSILMLVNVGLMVYLFAFNENRFLIAGYDEIFYTNLLFTLIIVLILIGGLINVKRIKYFISIYLFAFLFYVLSELDVIALINNPSSFSNVVILRLILLLLLTFGYFFILIVNKANTIVSKIGFSVINLAVVGLGVYHLLETELRTVSSIYTFISVLLISFYLLQIVVLYWLKEPKKEVVLVEETKEKEEVIEEEIKVEETVIPEVKKEKVIIEEVIEEEPVVEEIVVKQKKKAPKPTFVYNADIEKNQIMKRYEKMYKDGLITKEELNKIRRENGFDAV